MLALLDSSRHLRRDRKVGVAVTVFLNGRGKDGERMIEWSVTWLLLLG